MTPCRCFRTRFTSTTSAVPQRPPIDCTVATAIDPSVAWRKTCRTKGPSMSLQYPAGW
eukprot:CAMPEP_0172704250 /NCGR_PEP_ID=MMETSP1074-20121228/40737_1 /TAXON_ID=2916 /ORGANISM="Ceratium fusus, Strain PA161109" /LENGTH=57 /DNA_ID=CAMNT_0013526365 /DNA_START=68 /DNA_END=238 /DNA_ORIENTATION=-